MVSSREKVSYKHETQSNILLYINGEFTPASNGATIKNMNPITNKQINELAEAQVK